MNSDEKISFITIEIQQERAQECTITMHGKLMLIIIKLKRLCVR